jgi:adenylate cyclase
MLNEYFTEMVDEIFAWRGVLDKFLGDGICAVFTTVVDQEEPARRALGCATGMLARLAELNARRALRGEPRLEIGIGLHTGRLLAGTIGSPVRMEYTHIGDVVNIASRVQELTKRFEVPLLASADTVERAGGAERFASRDIGPAEIRGRAEPVQLFAIDATYRM